MLCKNTRTRQIPNTCLQLPAGLFENQDIIPQQIQMSPVIIPSSLCNNQETVWIKNLYTLFCSTFMNKVTNIYSLFNKMAAICMILALLWLTISAPFVFAAQQNLANYGQSAGDTLPPSASEEESPSPLGNATEEKAPSSSSFSEEYLHDHHTDDHSFSIALQFHKCENMGTYIAYHGELHVPPPNAA